MEGQKPSVGRIVHYHPFAVRPGEPPVSAAIITRVHNETCVNLTVFEDGCMTPATRSSVVLGEAEGCWSWPPRQPPAVIPSSVSA